MIRPFIKGLELGRLFYEEAVRPLLVAHFPDLLYSAARLDGGQVIHADDFAEALYAAFGGQAVRALLPHLGSVDQFVDSTDVLDKRERFGRLRIMYQ